MGYYMAGFDVVGVDSKPQPRYPFEFVQCDVFELSDRFVGSFDAVHASPPCQAFSLAGSRRGDHPDLIMATRRLLRGPGIAYVMENVSQAPLVDPLMLCGTMFPGLRVIRHRLFESDLLLASPGPCRPHPRCHHMRALRGQYGHTNEWRDFITVTGGGNSSARAAGAAMGIDWMSKYELNQAIPPAYALAIGKQLMASLR